MKKVLIRHTAFTLAIAAVFYLAWAFVLAETNPFRWSSDSRAGLAICVLLAGAFTNVVTAIEGTFQSPPKTNNP